MDKIRKYIFDSIEDNDALDLDKVAKVIGVSPRHLEYVAKGERNLTFRPYVKLAFLLDKENPHKRISEWCTSFDTTDCVTGAFEYASITRNVQLLDKLLTIHQEDEGKIGECVRVYSFILNLMKNNIKSSEMHMELKKIKKIKDSSLLLLKEIYLLISKYHAKEFHSIPNIGHEIEKNVKEMKEDKQFLKECFLHRLSEILAFTHLHLNNLVQARHYAMIILNGEVSIKNQADAKFIIGMSYLNTDRDECMRYMIESYETMKKTGVDFLIEEALYNLQYAQLLLGIKLPDDADKALKSVELFREGKISEDSVKEVVYGSGDADLISYFDGISGSSEELYDAYHEYVANANMYYASIMIQELIKSGENSGFVRSLVRMNFNSNKFKGDVLFEETFISSFNRISYGSRSRCSA